MIHLGKVLFLFRTLLDIFHSGHTTPMRKQISKHNLSKEDLLGIKGLGKDLIIPRPDKEQGIVLLNKSQYLEKWTRILGYAPKFCFITGITVIRV